MEQFRTPVSISTAAFHLHHGHRILALGSCFAQEAGNKLRDAGMQTLVNPWGTLFNTPALLHILEQVQSGASADSNYFTESDGRYLSPEYPSAVQGKDANTLQKNIRNLNVEVSAYLHQTDCVLLTLGTAWVYRHKAQEQIVASCHKIPAGHFEKILLTPEMQIASLKACIQQLRAFHSGIQIILTVSPVRHTRDTLPLNAVSKSVLRYACHAICEAIEGCSYFPSFEIMQDDLRDYRFYQADMIHPSAVAVDYIWEQFSRCYFNAETLQIQGEIAQLQKGLQHRPRTDVENYYKKILGQIEATERKHRIALQSLREKVYSIQQG